MSRSGITDTRAGEAGDVPSRAAAAGPSGAAIGTRQGTAAIGTRQGTAAGGNAARGGRAGTCRRTARSARAGDRGSATVLVAVAATVTLLLGAVATAFANVLDAAARARTAADLAALAAADVLGRAAGREAPCAGAARVAAANGADLVRCATAPGRSGAGPPPSVTVDVVVRAPFGIPVRARARAEPGAWAT